jgi:outer membrane protein OmpA-like peptidoglycan-associated protein
MINQKQLIVFKAGVFQLLLGVVMLFLLLKCTNKEKPVTQPEPAKSAMAGDSGKIAAKEFDSTYVPISGYHTEEVRQKLRELENKNFEKGTIADQLLDYLKRGENDLGETFKFIDLRFEKKSAEYESKFADEILEVATIMNYFPNLKIVLLSYTDSEGEEKANEKLTEERALKIKNKMMEATVASDRIEIKAQGEKYPVGDNKTYVGRMINNRVEMMILSK